ncbi:MAG: ABC transporter permease [Rhizobiaceae bacterium]|nr:ABC transporter permease [Rhizobiaceae bacterium]
MRRTGFLDFYALIFVAVLYGPVVLLPIFSFNDNIYITLPLSGFTVRWYEEMLSNESLMKALRTSIKLGLVVSVVSTTIGLCAAKALIRNSLPGRRAALGLVMLPLVVPSLALGVALLVTLRLGFGVELSLLTIGAGHVLICLPFATLVIMARMEGFDQSLEEASLDLGEGRFSTFRRITLPLTLPGIVASLLLSFTVSLDEFVMAFLLGGDDTTLPLFIWSQLRFPAKLPTVLALGSCILAFSFVMVVVANVVRRHGLPSQTSAR